MSTVYNKVTVNNNTLIDLSQDTVSDASHIRYGYTGHLNDGSQVMGSYTGEDSVSYEWTVLYNANAYITSGSPNYIVLTNFSTTMTDGEMWRVTWKGTEYTYEAEYDSGTDTTYIGNPGVVGGTSDGTGCPFFCYKRNSTELVFATTDSSGNFSLKVEKQVEVSGGATLITKTITANGTYSAEDDDADGYSEVTVLLAAMTLPTTASSTSSGTSKATISPSTSAQYLNIPTGYNGTASYYTISAMPSMTLPTSASGSSSGTSKATISRSTSNQYINIPTGYNGTASYYTISATPNMTLPSSASATASGSSKATITPGSSAQYINIPTGYNDTAQYYEISAASGGTSKNVQISNTPGRATSSTYTAVGPSITVSKSGKYDVYWTGYRSSTSGTSGSQLYIDSSAYGSADTSFNQTSGLTNLQNVHLSNVSLTKDQVLTIRARSRGNNYYMYILDLVIIEA